MTNDPRSRAALKFANELAKRAGNPTRKALLPGVPKSCAECPVAVTAGPGWEIGVMALRVGPRGGVKETVHIPDDVARFIGAFDRGEYPDLIAMEAVA